MNGSFSQPAILGREPTHHAKRARSLVRTGLVLAALCAATALVVGALPDDQISWELVAVVAVGSVLFVLLWLTLGMSGGRARYPKTVALIIVWFLISSEAFFMRFTEGDETLHGSFVFGAYAEASMWVIAFIALLIITLGSPQYIRQAFSGSYKWMTLYALLCVISTVLSPQLSFSLAWAFKLLVTTLVMEFYASHVSEPRDIAAFLWTLLLAFAFIPILRLVSALQDPAGVFEQGRLSGYVSWDTASVEAAFVLLLAMTIFSSTRSSAQRKWLAVFGTSGAALMVLSGGKAGIVAGMFSAILFYMLQKRVGSALGLAVGLSIVLALIVAFTPMAAYLREYSASGQASSLTGRTDLWASAIPGIWNKPVFGHGFMASKFLSTSKELELAWTAGHTHNGFLEVLYNNGAVGLVLVLALHVIILKNLFRVIRGTTAAPGIRLTATGCLAIYINLFINSIVLPVFGGRVDSLFVMFVALVFLSDWLVRVKDREVALSTANAFRS